MPKLDVFTTVCNVPAKDPDAAVVVAERGLAVEPDTIQEAANTDVSIPQTVARRIAKRFIYPPYFASHADHKRKPEYGPAS